MELFLYVLTNEHCVSTVFRAYENFRQAAEFNHTGALEYMSLVYLFGDYVPQDTDRAMKILEDLSKRGSTRGQLVSFSLLNTRQFWIIPKYVFCRVNFIVIQATLLLDTLPVAPAGIIFPVCVDSAY